MIEGFAWGGLLQQTTDVENYPGFPDGVMGPEMMQKFRDQAERFGARLITDEAERVSWRPSPAACTACGSATPSTVRGPSCSRWAPSTKNSACRARRSSSGRGVSYCATCDAAFFAVPTTLIVGGGDSAMEEAIFLSKFACQVTVVHRATDFRASKIMLERARAQDNIELLTPYTVREFVAGENGASAHAMLTNVETGEEREVRYRAHSSRSATSPSLRLSRDQLDVDENDYVITEGDPRAPSCRASLPPATSSTTSTGRPSPRPAPGARRRSMPSGTCATRRRCPRRAEMPEGDLAEAQWAPAAERA